MQLGGKVGPGLQTSCIPLRRHRAQPWQPRALSSDPKPATPVTWALGKGRIAHRPPCVPVPSVGPCGFPHSSALRQGHLCNCCSLATSLPAHRVVMCWLQCVCVVVGGVEGGGGAGSVGREEVKLRSFMGPRRK